MLLRLSVKRPFVIFPRPNRIKTVSRTGIKLMRTYAKAYAALLASHPKLDSSGYKGMNLFAFNSF
jgi:hypothetical protein